MKSVNNFNQKMFAFIVDFIIDPFSLCRVHLNAPPFLPYPCFALLSDEAIVWLSFDCIIKWNWANAVGKLKWKYLGLYWMTSIEMNRKDTHTISKQIEFHRLLWLEKGQYFVESNASDVRIMCLNIWQHMLIRPIARYQMIFLGEWTKSFQSQLEFASCTLHMNTSRNCHCVNELIFPIWIRFHSIQTVYISFS